MLPDKTYLFAYLYAKKPSFRFRQTIAFLWLLKVTENALKQTLHYKWN